MFVLWYDPRGISGDLAASGYGDCVCGIFFCYSMCDVYRFAGCTADLCRDRKLFILLSNAIDNAFNHCNDNKTINFSLTYVEPYHRFVIVNSFERSEEIKEDKEHGHGLTSMKKLVEEMKGELIIEEKENKFICTILIPTDEKIQ